MPGPRRSLRGGNAVATTSVANEKENVVAPTGKGEVKRTKKKKSKESGGEENGKVVSKVRCESMEG